MTKTKDEILQLIVEQKFTEAFNHLTKKFGKTNAAYNNLVNDFTNRDQNFNEVDYGTRLGVFVSFYFGPFNDEPSSRDKIYNTLCNLNFTPQTKYFNSFLKCDKPIVSFIVRARASYGQDWLFTKLIRQYEQEKPIFPPIIIDLKNIDTLSGVIDSLSKAVEGDAYDSTKDINWKSKRLKRKIIRLTETKTQFIVLKNAHTVFQKKVDFNSFYEILKEIYDDLAPEEYKHKCIFFFLENGVKLYQDEVSCIFSDETTVREARGEEGAVFIYLNEHEAISLDDLEDWFDNGMGQDFYEKCFKGMNGDALQELLDNSDNGNPEKVIDTMGKIFIDKTLDKDKSKTKDLIFIDEKKSWLKY